jgi:hypothetical protein
MNQNALDAVPRGGPRGRALDAPPESAFAIGHGAMDAVPSAGELGPRDVIRVTDHEAER